ncbi:MAG: CmpA/NrtA family ABC transporter substrate-binding protein [Burkholderiales bacterium]
MPNDSPGDDSPLSHASAERRAFVRRSGALTAGMVTGLAPGGARPQAHLVGSDGPEKRELRVGFVPLTDCAPLVVAAAAGFDVRHGIRIVLCREPSWASVRDKLLSGELDAAHALYGLVYATQLGLGSVKRDMAVLMTLNQNGQGITLSEGLRAAGVVDGPGFARWLGTAARRCTLAQTFPAGTHALWLNYWLAAHGIHPGGDVQTTVVTPTRMVAGLRDGAIDGYCAGEPWNARAVFDRIGFTVATSQDIWPDHPEKVLGCTADFVDRHPNAARALVSAVLEASRHLEQRTDRAALARLLADPAYVNTPAAVIESRLAGRYDDGRGRRWQDAHAIRFHGDGQVNFPWLSDGLWFLTQFRRWGLVREHPDYMAVVRAVNRTDLYITAATRAGVAVPHEPMRRSVLMDGVVWDGTDPARYAGGFAVHA